MRNGASAAMPGSAVNAAAPVVPDFETHPGYNRGLPFASRRIIGTGLRRLTHSASRSC
jgi:hypothetical protein